MFHASDFFIRQKLEVAYAFPCGESAIVLQAEANEEVDFPVGHVHDLLDGSLGLIVVGQERQFAGEFRIDGLIDESEERFRKNNYNPATHITFGPTRKIVTDPEKRLQCGLLQDKPLRNVSTTSRIRWSKTAFTPCAPTIYS